MSGQPQVTVICATRNAREAVRLTFASFRRHTPEPCTVLVADNGSTDGTLEDLRALPWLTVFSLEERRALMRAEAERARAQMAALQARLDAYVPELSAAERARLAALGAGAPIPPLGGRGRREDDVVDTDHGSTLDWLAARVLTPFFLTLDSDVEFLAAGWLAELLALAKRENLAALGQLELTRSPGQPRLAPHVLLLRTAAFRTLRASFQDFIRFEDPEEARRWQRETHGFYHSRADSSMFADYHSVAFYDTAAALLERLKETGARWALIPESTARKFMHLGHMSLASLPRDEFPAVDAFRPRWADRLVYVRERLRLYATPSQ